MKSQNTQSSEASAGAETLVLAAARDVLTAVGEVVYDWSITDDVIRWGANALEVLKVSSLTKLATGRDFGGLLDSNNLASRHDAVMNCTGPDDGRGVAYLVQYSLLADRQ